MIVTHAEVRLTELFEEMVSLRRHFHQYPELSFQEVETPKMIAITCRFRRPSYPRCERCPVSFKSKRGHACVWTRCPHRDPSRFSESID